MSHVINRLIGQGMHFPFKPNGGGGVDYNTSVERINQSLFILFSTEKGSRLLMPSFGSDLYKYRFELYDNVLLSKIRETIYADINRWEPRINIESVNFYDDDEARDNHILYISIKYKIINTEVRGSFVYPYKLEIYSMSDA